MSFGKFNTYEEVATQFHIKLREEAFVAELTWTVKEEIVEFIRDNLTTRRSYVSENAVCEAIIAPILLVSEGCGIAIVVTCAF